MNLLLPTIIFVSNIYSVAVSATDVNQYNVQPVCSAGDGFRRLLLDIETDSSRKTSSSSSSSSSWEDIALKRLHRRIVTSTNGTDSNKEVNFTRGTSGLDGSGGCNPPCLEDFSEICGKDGQCHASTCENIYLYGNSSFTGVLNANPPNLTCTIIDPATTDIDSVPVAVSHSCTDGIGADDTSRKNVIHMNRYCHAQPLDDYAFQCYELVPQNDTDLFSEFITNTNGSTTGYGCDETWVDPQDAVPQYIYNLGYGYLSLLYHPDDSYKNNCTNETAFRCEFGGYTVYGGTNSSIFNESVAYSAFYSQLSYINPPTNMPTNSPAPTTLAPMFAPPTGSSSNRLSFQITKFPEFLILLLGFLLS